MKLSDGEKLIAIMLADIMQANGIAGEVNPAFVKEAITSDNLWALKWEYSGLFHEEGPDSATIDETAEILTMCSFIEYSINELNPSDLANIPQNERLIFVGFDGNNDDHFGVGRMLIERMGRWPEFQDRDLNSHSQVIDRYRRMKAAYDANGGPIQGGLPLPAIQTILSA